MGDVSIVVPYSVCLFYTFAVVATRAQMEMTMEAIKHAVNYQNYNPMSSNSHNPWISGPNQKKYQFHVGQQSWLAAREICLAENSDLITISSEEELDWILSHYKPQLKQFRERQLQVGLLVENTDLDSSKSENWQWVDTSPLNTTFLSWTANEPFDHAEGRERCGVLNVNKRTLEDVDCDLTGTINLYRFICERSHQRHLKHEELNNPLWKKLEDILVFFGISQSSSAVASNETTLIASNPQAEDEDYWDKIKLNSTEASKAEGSGEEPKPTHSVASSNWTVSSDELDRTLLTTEKPADDELLKPSDKLPSPPVVPNAAAYGTKLLESSIHSDDDLLTNKELERIDQTKAPVQEVTANPSPQRTTKSDPLVNLADTLESKVSKSHLPTNERMRSLERIINAVQIMLEEPEKVGYKRSSNSSRSQRKSDIASLFEYPLSQLRAQILVAPTGTPPTRKPLPTPRAAQVFKRPPVLSPLTSRNRQFPFRESNEQPDWGSQQQGISVWDGDLGYQQHQNKPKTLHSTFRNQLFSSFSPNVQWSSEDNHPETYHQYSLDPEMYVFKHLDSVYSSLFDMLSGQTSTTTVQAAVTKLPVAIASTTEGLEIVQLIEKHNRELVDYNLVDSGVPHEQIKTALNLEGDFEQAKADSLAQRPNSDFLLPNKQEELIGCGAKNLGATRPPTSTSTVSAVNKTEQINNLLKSLHGILTTSPSNVFSDLLDSGNNPQAVLEALQKVVQKSNEPSTTTRSPEETQKIRKRVEYEILKSLEELHEVESQEFVDLKDNRQELLAIGSGAEPPNERLISLTPIVLTARQATTADSTTSSAAPITTSETLKKSAEAEGFNVNLLLRLPNTDVVATSQSKVTIPEFEEEEGDVTQNVRAKFQQKLLEKMAANAKSEEEEASGMELKSVERREDRSMEKLNAEISESVFPRPNFSLLKNKKLEAQHKKSLALEKERVDKAYNQFNSTFNSQSVFERIRQSEAERAKSPNATIETTTTDVRATRTLTFNSENDKVANTLEEIINDWMELLN